jgi:hypothetical protein
MIKITLKSIHILLFLIAFGSIVDAEMAKQGTVSGGGMWGGTHTMIQIDEDHLVVPYENTGVWISDTGEGPFNNLSTRNLGILYYEKGIGRLLGYYIMMDPEGDTVVMEIKETESSLEPKPIKGTGKIVSGTGKFSGIVGSVEYTRWELRPVAEGTHQGMSKSKMSWKLPRIK